MVLEYVGNVMDALIGWLLDVTVERNAATLWVKTTQKDVLRLTDKYQPCFYILPRNEQAGTELFHILSQQTKTRVEWHSKHTDIDHDGYEKLLCVYLESTYYYNTLVKRLQNDPRVAKLTYHINQVNSRSVLVHHNVVVNQSTFHVSLSFPNHLSVV